MDKEKVFEFDTHLKDGRITMPPKNNKSYDLRAAIKYREQLGRVLTDEEMEIFLIKEEKKVV